MEFHRKIQVSECNLKTWAQRKTCEQVEVKRDCRLAECGVQPTCKCPTGEGGGQRSKVDGRVPAITQTREEAEPMFSVQNILYMFRT